MLDFVSAHLATTNGVLHIVLLMLALAQNGLFTAFFMGLIRLSLVFFSIEARRLGYLKTFYSFDTFFSLFCCRGKFAFDAAALSVASLILMYGSSYVHLASDSQCCNYLVSITGRTIKIQPHEKFLPVKCIVLYNTVPPAPVLVFPLHSVHDSLAHRRSSSRLPAGPSIYSWSFVHVSPEQGVWRRIPYAGRLRS